MADKQVTIGRIERADKTVATPIVWEITTETSHGHRTVHHVHAKSRDDAVAAISTTDRVVD